MLKNDENILKYDFSHNYKAVLSSQSSTFKYCLELNLENKTVIKRIKLAMFCNIGLLLFCYVQA